MRHMGSSWRTHPRGARVVAWLLAAAAVWTGCGDTVSSKEIVSAVTLSKENLGRSLTVEGRAVNAKLGAQLVGDGFTVWIQGLSTWPEGYWSMGQPGKKLRVTGILVEDHALPVFRADMERALETAPAALAPSIAKALAEVSAAISGEAGPQPPQEPPTREASRWRQDVKMEARCQARRQCQDGGSRPTAHPPPPSPVL